MQKSKEIKTATDQTYFRAFCEGFWDGMTKV